MNSDPLAPYRAGSTEPWAVSVLQTLVRLTRPYHLLELGTFEGKTTRRLAAVMPPNGVITTVDIEQRHEEFEDRSIAFVKADALDYLTRLAPNGEIDFAFVDDNHEKAHVAAEVDLLLDRVIRRGGIVVVHDVIGPFGLDEVVTSRGGWIVELPLLHAAGGLGILQV